MINNKVKYLLMLICSVALLSACKKQWDQRTAIANQQLSVTLMEQIKANPNLSTFAKYLTQTGLDQVLASSKTFTVFAPTNTAMQSLDPAIASDPVQLRLFISNHIANQTYLASGIQSSIRIHVLTGKNVTFTRTTVEDANITTADQYVSNGSLNIIDKILPVKLNISDFVRGLTTVGALQSTYIKSQDTTYVDTTQATVQSLDPKTGKPILVPGTGVVKYNKYFKKTAALDNEDSTYTYIVLTDVAMTTERGKVSKYFTTVTNSTDTTNMLASFNVLKDVAIRGMVKPADLPASLKSVNGVTVPIDKSAIVQTYNASNGIVYVMSAVNFNVSEKITPITIQGEFPSFFMRADRASLAQYRIRPDNNGKTYNDMFLQFSSSTTLASFFAAYRVSGLNTCQYRVYLRAVNDTAFNHIANPGNISQRITFGQVSSIVVSDAATGTLAATTAVNYPYQNSTPYNYTPMEYTGATAGTVTANSTINVVGGRLNVTKLSTINMYLQGANTTTVNANNLLIDYIRLDPVIQ